MKEEMENAKKSVFHIEDLKFGNVEGVLEVVSFTPAEISLKIASGGIEICGSGLEVKSFDVQSQSLTFAGEITSIALRQTKQSLLKRLTK